MTDTANSGKATATVLMRRLAAAILAAVVLVVANPVLAAPQVPAEPMQISAQDEGAFGRIVMTFPERFELPGYTVGWDNGVLVVTFDTPAEVELPDLSAKLGRYVTAARVDPDKKGIRIGLKGSFKVNKTEAGESLYLDILPTGWTGPDPGLPSAVVEKLSRRARDAATVAEQKRKAEYVREHQPTATIHVGRHPTFVRLIMDWSMKVKANYAFDAPHGRIDFDWPVKVDLYELMADLPPEIVSVDDRVDKAGSHLTFKVADGVAPRFYENSPSQFVLDFDSLKPDSSDIDIASLLPANASDETASGQSGAGAEGPTSATPDAPQQPVVQPTGAKVVPYARKVGSTVRIVFPFTRDTAAAVFRRADTLWMVFDTPDSIEPPDGDKTFDEIAQDFSVSPAGGTSVVRIRLASDKLATLGSEGRSWVLSLGDIVLSPAELMTFSRRQTDQGLFEIAADVVRPSKVHQIRDPEVGDILDVVTVFPPARGVARELDHVDYAALRSVHGLVIQPYHDDVSVDIEGQNAVIKAARGLIVSSPRTTRGGEAGKPGVERDGYVDYADLVERDPRRFNVRVDQLMNQAAAADREQQDIARLDLADFYVANRMPQEALGVLDVLQRSNLKVDSLVSKAEMARAAADTLAGHWQDALDLMNTDIMAARPDALFWRTIAKAGAGDFEGARVDALAAEPVIRDYPPAMRSQFLLASIRSAVEQGDTAMATRYLGFVDTAELSPDDLAAYQVLSARLDAAAGRFDAALDTLGQVIATDLRPSRAEAIYRTLRILDRMGKLDPKRAAETLATETMVWRGDDLEARMLEMLAGLYFRNKSYRDAFETVRTLATAYPKSSEAGAVLDEAKQKFADLYLNGEADALAPVDALTLYYDFRNFTPAGARGDEMVRNLARRLIKVDLLTQAEGLLQYQVDNRLDGAAKAQIAADLAVIYLADRKPGQALAALNGSRVSGLPSALDRQRRIIEARALVDSGREDLALDILSSMDGRDADLLRADAQWRAKRYDSASETLERLYAADFNATDLSSSARANIVKAAVGFVLANDTIGIGRLRERFGQAMSDTPEWPLFDFVTGKVTATSLEFRKVAKQIADVDSLNAFLATYNETYGADGALTPPVKARTQAGA